jgi:hypothetical protein
MVAERNLQADVTLADQRRHGALTAKVARMVEAAGDASGAGTSFAGMAITWEYTGDGELPYRARVNGVELLVRVNDFPAEPLYSLLVNGQPADDLEDWPDQWVRPGVPADSLRRAAASQVRRGRVDAIVAAAWATALCALPRGRAGDALAALNLEGTLAEHVGYRRLDPPPPGTSRLEIAEERGDACFVRVVLSGAGPSRSELDAMLGPGRDVVRVHFDQPYPVCYRVTVAAAPYSCDVFAYFAGPPDSQSTAQSLLFRRQAS